MKGAGSIRTAGGLLSVQATSVAMPDNGVAAPGNAQNRPFPCIGQREQVLEGSSER